MYNPLIHKKPYGATAVDKETTIVFPLDTLMGVKRVFIVLRKDDRVLRIELSETIEATQINCKQQNPDEQCRQQNIETNSEKKHIVLNSEQTIFVDEKSKQQNAGINSEQNVFVDEKGRQQNIETNSEQKKFSDENSKQKDPNINCEQNVFTSENCEKRKGSFTLDESGIWHYRFEGELENGDLIFFGRNCDGTAICGDWLPEWQLTVSKSDYKTPNWAKQGVTYQAFADRFCKGEDRPFKKHGILHSDWDEQPLVEVCGEDYLADDFFGGNIAGIISKLDYLKSLNVTCLYLSPIFLSSSNHRYDTSNYLQIDELFGDEKQFVELVQKAEALDIFVMLDGVFNHTGADSLYFNKFGNFPTLGAYQSKKSPYFDWFYFYDFPNDYHCWWGSTVVPTVNKSASGYLKLVLEKDGVIEKWTKLGVKGWRLDVVDELPIDFTNKLCKKIKSIDDDTLIVGEVWEDASTKVSYGSLRPYFMGEQLDSVMNYPFKLAILDFAFSGNKEEFQNSVTRILENYPKESLDVLMNLIDSHDTVRALTLLSGANAPISKQERANYKLNESELTIAKQRLKLASILQFTLPGVPCVYYGDEAGQQGFEDPINRATYPWGREDKELLAHYRALGDMRKRHADLLQGEMSFEKDNELLVYTRKICEENTTEDEMLVYASKLYEENTTEVVESARKVDHANKKCKYANDKSSTLLKQKNAKKLMVVANATNKTISRNITGVDALTEENFEVLQIEPLSARIVILKTN